MGTENLFHLNKERAAKDLARRDSKRAPYDSVLIVCEGEKTEVNYFKNLIEVQRLNTANIEVTSCAKGTAPITIVNYAIAQAKKRPYLDKVYCVFDRDDHSSFNQALQKIADLQSKKNKIKFFAITSTPCFEIWPLLHFKYTTKQFTRTQNNSGGDNLIAELRSHLPDYQKNITDLYERLKAHLTTAFKNAERLREDNAITENKNPSTDVDQLVKYFVNIEKS